MAKLTTSEMRREKSRPKRNYFYVINPDTGEIQRTLGKPTKKPKVVIYLPHYEDSLRVEVEMPDGNPDQVQEKLDDLKDKFVNWFGGTKKTGYNWGNKTRRFVYNKIALRVRGVKVPREENRAMRTLFMYKGILNEFKKGKTRKSIVEEIEHHKKFSFEQVRVRNKRSVKTGVVMQTTRKGTTINRDITSLVKVGILKKIGKGLYEVVREKEISLESINRAIIHKK